MPGTPILYFTVFSPANADEIHLGQSISPAPRGENRVWGCSCQKDARTFCTPSGNREPVFMQP
jgi:hypothetical protein